MSSRESEAARIFLEAVEHYECGQRAQFVREAAAEDPILLQRVDALLIAHEEPNPLLDGDCLAPKREIPQPNERPGTVIGPYKLLEQIGEGGMGLVFMAEQTQPVRRSVALKVIKPGMDTQHVVARFEAERQALALMDHPNIAKIHDGGATDSGRPYFVMELVRGVPITEFCDQRRFTTRQRLELFVTVCQAVQHAHQKGIIHRDLKPSNVLVTLHDVVAVPKIIDFGIAKATTQPLTERTLFTNFAQMMGTPLYMSPEQAEMNGLDVDTRSDVYALGVLLYELLTGTTPFESQTLKKVGLDEIRRMIREEEPPTPSQRLSTLAAQDCGTVSERRGADSRRLGQVLRGELDWIVMKALEKDRNRRYESVSAFAVDVQRYLNDEAVAACPPSAGYRLRKYVRRNRRVLAMVGVVAASLITATAVSIWQAARATDAQHQAEADRKQVEADRDRARAAEGKAETNLERAKEAEKRATTEAAIARAVNNFLQDDLLRQANSAPQDEMELKGKSNLTVREALDRVSARVAERFPDQPVVEASIRMAIGDAYGSLEEFQLAIPQMKRAVALRQTHLGLAHPDTLDSMERLAGTYSWAARSAEAIALRKEVLASCTATLGPDHSRTLRCVCALAEDYQRDGQFEINVSLLEDLLEKQRRICGPVHEDTLNTMHSLARGYMNIGRFADAITVHESFFDGIKSAKAPDHEPPLWPMLTFAQACLRAGELDRAERLLRDVLEQFRKRGTSSRHARANALGWLALTMLLQERYAEAEPLVREARAYYEKEFPDNPGHFYWMSLLGAVLLGQQKYAEAEPLILQGYEGMKQRQTRCLVIRLQLAEASQRVVRFYERTNQPEKARTWREKLKARVK
jgi:eukaryotic-like serine/threonine-protein kinase